MNQRSHPDISQSRFNNWEIIPNGWYIACASREIRRGRAKSLMVCGQRVVIFRGQDRRVRSLDAFCPHMGADLGMGTVRGDRLRCPFHQWEFDETGRCQQIPCQTNIPDAACLQSYKTEEKYGFIWIYPAADAPYPVPEFDDLQGKHLLVWHEFPAKIDCHPHLHLINAVDAQHLTTIHQLPPMTPQIELNSGDRVIDFTFRGQFAMNSFKARLIGKNYEYTIRYVDSCLGLLSNIQKSPWFPTLHTMFAPISLAPGTTKIQPIYVTERGRGIIGLIKAWIALVISRYVYLHVLLVDREIRVLENMRFKPNILLAIDAPVVTFIRYVNQLSASIWSVNHSD